MIQNEKKKKINRNILIEDIQMIESIDKHIKTVIIWHMCKKLEESL